MRLKSYIKIPHKQNLVGLKVRIHEKEVGEIVEAEAGEREGWYVVTYEVDDSLARHIIGLASTEFSIGFS